MAVTLSMSATEQGKNYTEKYTEVLIEVTAHWTGGSYNWNQASGWLNADGTKYYFSSSFNDNSTTSGSKVIYSRTIKVYHDDDGEKTLVCQASYTTGTSSGTVTDVDSWELTPIPDLSTFTCTCTNSSYPLGTALSFSVTRGDTTLTHSLTYVCGSTSGTILSKSTTTSKSWTPPLTLAKQNTTGTTVPITFTLTTYKGDVVLGSVTLEKTLSIPDSVKPTVSISVTDQSGCYSKYGKYVQGQSYLKVALTASGSQGSEITKYSADFDGYGYVVDTFTTEVIKSSGSLVLKATVKDSRGRTGTASITLTVLEYALPKISDLTIRRCDSDGTANSSGTYLSVTFSASVSPLDSKNSAKYTLKYKKKTETSYITKTLTALAGTYQATNASVVFAADTSSSYDVTLTVTDDFKAVDKSNDGSSIKKLWSAFKKGLGFAFGKVAEKEGALDMGFYICMNGNRITDLPEPTDATDVATKGYVDALAVEDADNPGCFYHMVDGEKEWINPPLYDGTEYRTTERFDGKPVYSKYIYYKGTEDVDGGVGTIYKIPHGVSDIYQLRSIEVQLGRYILPLMSGASSISVNYVDATDVGIQYYNYDVHAGYVLRIFMRYIKK